MKIHVLTAAVLSALASQVVMAASEGGDTWSRFAPQLDGQPTSSAGLNSAPVSVR